MEVMRMPGQQTWYTGETLGDLLATIMRRAAEMPKRLIALIVTALAVVGIAMLATATPPLAAVTGFAIVGATAVAVSTADMTAFQTIATSVVAFIALGITTAFVVPLAALLILGTVYLALRIAQHRRRQPTSMLTLAGAMPMTTMNGTDSAHPFLHLSHASGGVNAACRVRSSNDTANHPGGGGGGGGGHEAMVAGIGAEERVLQLA